jgi:hypothetical protein
VTLSLWQRSTLTSPILSISLNINFNVMVEIRFHQFLIFINYMQELRLMSTFHLLMYLRPTILLFFNVTIIISAKARGTTTIVITREIYKQRPPIYCMMALKYSLLQNADKHTCSNRSTNNTSYVRTHSMH